MAESACGCCSPDRPTETPTCYCPVDELLDVVSREHALEIVGLLASDGPRRHSEIADALDVSSSSVLANRLRELSELGVLERRSYDCVPPRVEYSLTDSGRAFERRLQPLLEWATTDDPTADPE